MTPRPDGNYDVSPNEHISFTITKSLPNCAASVNLSGAALSCSVTEFPVCKQCSFTAPATPGAKATLTMSLDFQSDANGDFADGDMYTVQFAGAGGSVPARRFLPPPKLGLFFIFFVH